MSTLIKPPLKYHGGKFYLCKWIISHLPQHNIYVEPFGGAASVLLNKQKVEFQIYNDLNPELVNLFIQIQKNVNELQSSLNKLDYEESFYYQCKSVTESSEFESMSDLDRAVFTYAVFRMSRGGTRTTFSKSKRIAANGLNAEENAWKNSIDRLSQISKILEGVDIFCQDAKNLIQIWLDIPGALLYLDPPYPLGSRISKSVYQYEMTDDQHVSLCELVKRANSKVVISTYENEIYEDILGWNKVVKEIPNHSAHGRKKEIKREIIYKNF